MGITESNSLQHGAGTKVAWIGIARVFPWSVTIWSVTISIRLTLTLVAWRIAQGWIERLKWMSFPKLTTRTRVDVFPQAYHLKGRQVRRQVW